MISIEPLKAAPCRAVKSASFTAFTAAPASMSNFAVSRADGDGSSLFFSGLKVFVPSPAAIIKGVVPSSVVRLGSMDAQTADHEPRPPIRLARYALPRLQR